MIAALGFDDYGIYNVVGGVVTMFAFINAAMGNATNRFITYALGKGDKDHTINVVNTSLLVHILISILIVILAETVGLWFLYHKMVIPASKFTAALWVYQFSVIACVATIMCGPFYAIIVAHERMGAFAFISILDVIFKLGIAYAITLASSQRLILYAALYLVVNLLDILIYQIYCIRNFDDVKFRKPKDLTLLKEMTGFASWSLIGNLAYILSTQGVNVLLNVFFGPVVNAARGIAVQVQSAIKGFVTNFQLAINPQITKSYAAGEIERLNDLIVAGSKFSFFLLLCITLPISLEIKPILALWLVNVPDYTAQFAVLTLCVSLVDTLANPLGIANNATGSIRNYQLVEGGTLLLILPIAYIVLKLGGNPVSVFLTQLIITIIVQILRIFLVCHKINMRKADYFSKIILRVTIVTVCSVVPSVILAHFLNGLTLSIIYVPIISAILVVSFSFLLGLSKSEKEVLLNKLSKFTHLKSHFGFLER